MDFSSIKTFIVGGDKIARPKSINEITLSGSRHRVIPGRKERELFNEFAKQHHYAVDESLTPGEYEADKVELVWQFRRNINYNWNTFPKDSSYFDNYSEFEREYCFQDWECREALRLKQQPKTEPKAKSLANG